MFPFLSLFSKLPTWMRKFVPMLFYVTETAWNFYPYTITGQFKHSFTINTTLFEYYPASSDGTHIHHILLNAPITSRDLTYHFSSLFLPIHPSVVYCRVHSKYSLTSALIHEVCLGSRARRMYDIIILPCPPPFLSLFLRSSHECSFLPRLQVKIETHFLNDNGCSENVSEYSNTHTNTHTVCSQRR